MNVAEGRVKRIDDSDHGRSGSPGSIWIKLNYTRTLTTVSKSEVICVIPQKFNGSSA